ncbi:hypothetical protein F7725_016229 [Dissostichus mawsoni]|uniref:Uncharacterized protein n=1 Tax=Dissostichus mawsoni TaxID=36200 RepID=A0A7J5Z1H8_DISMA|nr:hypothetical protein F7725_016229 [Dissostichus mawsoni]
MSSTGASSQCDIINSDLSSLVCRQSNLCVSPSVSTCPSPEGGAKPARANQRPDVRQVSCSTPTWCPVSQWEKEKQRSPWLQGGTIGTANRAPRMLLCPAFSSATDRYRPPGEIMKKREEYKEKYLIQI